MKLCACEEACHRTEMGIAHVGPCKNWARPHDLTCVTCRKTVTVQMDQSQLAACAMGIEKERQARADAYHLAAGMALLGKAKEGSEFHNEMEYRKARMLRYMDLTGPILEAYEEVRKA